MSDTNTAVTTQPEENARGIALFDGVKDRCITMMGGEDRFLKESFFLLHAVDQTPALGACTKRSVVAALISAANTGLSMDPVRKETYLIPRNVKIRKADGSDGWEKRIFLVPSYMGLMKTATDTGSVNHFEAQVVFAGDDFEYDLVKKVPTHHRPYWTLKRDRGDLMGCYGFAKLPDGSIIPEHMGADELALIRSKSDNKDAAIYKDWQSEMARKALLKRLRKYVPMSDRSDAFLKAIALDNESFEHYEQHSIPTDAVDRTVQELSRRVRTALDHYTGEDADQLRDLCRDKALAGEFTEAFAKNILAQIGAAQN